MKANLLLWNSVLFFLNINTLCECIMDPFKCLYNLVDRQGSRSRSRSGFWSWNFTGLSAWRHKHSLLLQTSELQELHKQVSIQYSWYFSLHKENMVSSEETKWHLGRLPRRIKRRNDILYQFRRKNGYNMRAWVSRRIKIWKHHRCVECWRWQTSGSG
jgi:hypothetical protein